MTDFEKIFSFNNLYKAHTKARKSKRDKKEVIQFELNLFSNLTRLSDSLKSGTYMLSGYYSFKVHEPKVRTINALHYVDRVVQHCICDEVLAPCLDKKLIYDNAACRVGKGTHFALRRVRRFLQEFYKSYNTKGFILKFDIRKFFDNIDHMVLKNKLSGIIADSQVLSLLFYIIDSYEISPGKGLPLGNQTSQWFAIFYMDSLDRLIKEKLHIKYYSRYMDDAVLIHHDKKYLKNCLKLMKAEVEDNLHLQFNDKTQIFPLKNGVNYLGWHIYLGSSGKVICRIYRKTKRKLKKCLRYMKTQYQAGNMSFEKINETVMSYKAHLAHGHTYKLRRKVSNDFILVKNTD